MSSTVCLQRTTFIDSPTGDKSFGYRMYDDYSKAWSNMYEEDFLSLPPLEALRQVSVNNETEEEEAMLNWLRENKRGIEIDGEWFYYDQIESVLKE